jgi:hypothetical protein
MKDEIHYWAANYGIYRALLVKIREVSPDRNAWTQHYQRPSLRKGTSEFGTRITVEQPLLPESYSPECEYAHSVTHPSIRIMIVIHSATLTICRLATATPDKPLWGFLFIKCLFFGLREWTVFHNY